MQFQCPHCQSCVDLDSLPAHDRVCPSCGDSISVEPGGRATATWLPDYAPRRLGKFQFLERLGAGSFGTVYKARDTELDRVVAIKIPRGDRIASEEARTRFLREARNAAHLRHPGIVALYDAGQDGENCYLVCEFIQGASLAERLSAGRLSFRKAAELLAAVADSLQYAHAQGVIHRDIKPSNIMLDLSGAPHLMDFGLAKRAADEMTMTIEGQVLGTPAYMSPEQARGETRQIDARSDVYSLGVILYELLTGELPFRGQTRMLLMQVIQDEPRPPRSLNDQIPRDLETICLKTMAKEPGKRYASAGELADDLRRFLKGEPIQARPVGRIERQWRWCKRNPAVAIASASAALGLVATAILSLWFGWYHIQAAEALQLQNEKTELALEQTQKALHEARLQAALQMLERGQGLCAQQQVSQGLYWLIESLQQMPDDEQALHRVVRANLGQWFMHASVLRMLFPHPSRLAAVALSPDGKTVLTGCGDGTARLWDAATGRPLGLPLVHGGPVRAVAYSPDGRTVLTGSDDRAARLWDTTTGRQIGSPLLHQDKVLAVAYSPDGTKLLTGSEDKTARLWAAATGSPIGPPLAHQGKISVLAFSPDSRMVATGSDDKQVRLWDAATGQPLGAALQHDGEVRALAFSPDGTVLLTGSMDRTARLWATATGRLVRPPVVHPKPVVSVAFSPDGKKVLTGCEDHWARLWDAQTGQSLGVPMGHQGNVTRIAFSPCGKNLATGSDDHTARVWEAATGHALSAPLQHGHWLVGLAFSPDGRFLLTGSLDGMARIWETTTRQSLGVLQHSGLGSYALDPSGQVLVTGGDDHAARLRDMTTGRPVGPPLVHEQAVDAVAFSPDGKTVLTASADFVARLWDVATGKTVGPPLRHLAKIGSVAFRPDGKVLLTGSDDETARLWDAATGQPIGPPLQHRGRVAAVTFSPDGKMALTGSWDHTARLWDASTGQPIGTPLEHEDVVWAVAFSRDGRLVLTGSWDHTAQIWETATGRRVGSPVRLPRSVWGVDFSPEGDILLTGSWDRTARLWDAATGRPIGAPWQHQAGVEKVLFDRDGMAVLTESADLVHVYAVHRAVQESPQRLREVLSVLTGLELEASGALRMLSADDWQKRRRPLLDQRDAWWQPERLLPRDREWHILQAAEAEQQGNPFAALWHLDRLIALEANDWYWHACRGRIHLTADSRQQAEADFARAQACPAGRQLRNWFAHQLISSRAAGQKEPAAWYARALAAKPASMSEN